MSFIAVGIGLSVAGSAVSAISANKAKKEAERKEAKSREEMNQLKDSYSQLDTSNPYANMENTMEDLTIDQRQFDLESQQLAQRQSNQMSAASEAAGSSGVAGVAAALAAEGQIASQQAGSSVGMQEKENQMKERNMARNLQYKEREGEVWSRNAEKDKVGTLLGMSQAETAAYREQAAAAEQAKWDAIAGGVDSIGNMLVQPPGAGGIKGNGGIPSPSPKKKLNYNPGPPCPGLV